MTRKRPPQPPLNGDSPAEPPAPLNEHVKAWQQHVAGLGGKAGGHRWTTREASKAARARWARVAQAVAAADLE